MSTKTITRPAPHTHPRDARGRFLPAAARTRLSLIKPLRPLPHRTPAAGRSPEAIERAIAHAALAATERSINASLRGWNPIPTGVEQRTDHATLLRHSGQVGAPFTALVLCRQGAEHVTTVVNGPDLDAAHRAADACTRPHSNLRNLMEPVSLMVSALSGWHRAVTTLQHAKGLTS